MLTIDKDDAELLQRIWRAEGRALLAKLESGEDLKAAELNVIRQFLSDNGINLQTLGNVSPADALNSMLDNLPFPADGDHRSAQSGQQGMAGSRQEPSGAVRRRQSDGRATAGIEGDDLPFEVPAGNADDDEES